MGVIPRVARECTGGMKCNNQETLPVLSERWDERKNLEN